MPFLPDWQVEKTIIIAAFWRSQQRVAIARALIDNTGNLDSRTSVEIMGIFQQLNNSGITIVMVTHKQDIAAFARRNVVMHDGLVQ